MQASIKTLRNLLYVPRVEDKTRVIFLLKLKKNSSIKLNSKSRVSDVNQ